jgi:hypothetical protein
MSAIRSYAQVHRIATHMRHRGDPPDEIAAFHRRASNRVERCYRRRLELGRSTVLVDGMRERLETILALVCKAMGVDPECVRGPGRPRARTANIRRACTPARRAFAWAAYKTGASLTEIAAFMSRPGAHSSVIYWRDGATPDEQRIGQAAFDDEGA